jgi:hypothetical protein
MGMDKITPMQKQALRYVYNTNGEATKEVFVEDHAPVGERLWQELDNMGLAYVGTSGRIFLTDRGEQERSTG